MIVVPVLIISCQVSEKLKIGPVIAQTMMMVTARKNAHPEPTTLRNFGCELAEEFVHGLSPHEVTLRSLRWLINAELPVQESHL